MPENEYPQRPKFYANRVTRLMFKTAAANDLGSDVCYLVTQIAHQEDASRYTGPVTFWNEQLMSVCGFRSVRALDRARDRAIKAGWLVYEHGGKGKVGRYWTLIPKKYATFEDGAIDESKIAAELTATVEVASQSAEETPDKRQTNAEETPDIVQRTAEEQPEKCLTFLPNPNPTYKEINTAEIAGMDLFIPVAAFCRNPAVTGIEIGGDMVEYFEKPREWEAEFIRRWNKLSGVHPRNDELDTPLRTALQQRLCEEKWFWRRAFELFPTKSNMTHVENLSWFFSPRTVSLLLDGTYHQKDATQTKGKKNGKSHINNPGELQDLSRVGKGVKGWGDESPAGVGRSQA